MTAPIAAHDGVEVEWQFETGDLERVRAWLEAQPAHAPLRFTQVRDVEQVDSYYDTSDWRLFLAGLSLRRRRRGEAYELTLKSLDRAASGPISRREVNEPSEDGEVPAESGPVSDRVRLVAGRHPLQRLFEVRTRRRTYAVEADGARVASVELDETTIAPHTAPPTTFRRVEVEMEPGATAREVESFVAAMAAANSLAPTQTSKFEAGLLAAGLDPEAALDFGSTERRPDADALTFAYAWLREHWAWFLRHEPGTRLGEDIEALHQMRVGTRRLRATIRVFERVLPEAFAALRDELQWVGHELGAVRDLDVQIDGLERMRTAAGWADASALLPLIEVVEEQRRAERARLLDLLNSDRYEALVARMSTALRREPASTSEAGAEHGGPVAAYARPILERRYRRVKRDGRSLTAASPPVDYHRLRIRGKRLRYSLELFGELYGRPAERMTATLKRLQDLLGDHQDAEVAIGRMQEIVAEHGRRLPPETLVLVGRLMEQHRRSMEALRAEFPALFDTFRDRWKPLRRAVRDADTRALEASRADDEALDAPGPSTAVEPATPAVASRPTPPPTGDASWSHDAAPRSPAAPSLDPADGGALQRMRHLFRRD